STSVAIVILTLTIIALLLSFSPVIGFSQFSISPSSANQVRNTVVHKSSHRDPSSNEGNTIIHSSTQSKTGASGGCINYNPSTRKITVSCSSARLTDIDNNLHDSSSSLDDNYYQSLSQH